jgi:hypothetical protein
VEIARLKSSVAAQASAAEAAVFAVTIDGHKPWELSF